MMEQIRNIEDINCLKYNKVIGCPVIENCNIIFGGGHNILVCEENVKLVNSKVNFNADNSLIYLSSNKHIYYLDVVINHNSIMYIGENNYLNGILHVVISEEKNVIIGDDNLFSFDIWLRTADPHLVYSIKDKKRVNLSKNIFIGDHIWVGQHAMILKGSKIGSGSIIGAMALVAGKEVPSNESWGGNPAHMISSNIIWEGSCVHRWKSVKTKKSIIMPQEYKKYDYSGSDGNNIIERLEIEMENQGSSEERLEYVRKNLCNNKKDMRFAIKPTKKNKFVINIHKSW